MADSKLRDLSTDFAVKVIKMCDSIKGHYSLVDHGMIAHGKRFVKRKYP